MRLGRRKAYPLNIELEVYKGPQCRLFLATGVRVENVSQWDDDRQVIVRMNNAYAYNLYLHTMIQNIERAELEVENRGGIVTKELIRKAAQNKGLYEETNAIEKFLSYNAEEKIKESTMQSHKTFIRTLQRFVDYRKGTSKSHLYFNEITLPFVEEFDKFMLRTINQYSVVLTHITIRGYITRAVKEGLMKSSPYDAFPLHKPKRDKKPALTQKQLSHLESISAEQLESLGKDYDIILDRFLFSCYTGLRLGDNLSLLKSEISRSAKGLTLQKTTQKTGETVILPLYMLFGGKPQEIARKYIARNVNGQSGVTLFPRTNTKIINEKLKRIFDLVGIPTEYSFHISRHTCATMLAERVDNPFVVKDILGHGNIKTSMVYISGSHKTADKKLKDVQWSDDENLSDRSLAADMGDIEQICRAKGITDVQTYIVLGVLVENPDKSGIIKAWLGSLKDGSSFKGKDLDDRLQTLISINQ